MTTENTQKPVITIYRDENNSISIQTADNANVLEIVGILSASQKLYLDQVYSIKDER